MKDMFNPFQFIAATSLPSEQLIEYFIEDHNFSRFVKSNRNIFLVGERGSGKTMNLLYHSIEIQEILASKADKPLDLSYIGVYIPCNTPLYQKQEYQLFDDKFLPVMISENFFILDIAYYIFKSIDVIRNQLLINNYDEIADEVNYILNINVKKKNSLFGSLMQYFKKETVEYQKKILNGSDIKTTTSWTFYSLVIPIFGVLRKIEQLKNTHFMLMIDDIQCLNEYQRKILNGLISYRDNSFFSCKIATPKINKVDMTTSSGGTILEGHDYLEINMVQPFQNRNAAFSDFAAEIIEKRLQKISKKKLTADKFFPPNPNFEAGLQEANKKLKEIIFKNYPDWSLKRKNDYVYKFGRVQYFRDRAVKANNPPYSGFEIITHLSTGVVRNLLDPCYWMFEKLISKKQDNIPIESIPPNIQTDVILARSRSLWQQINDGLECKVQGCTEEQSEAIKNLFEKLSILFRYRLLNHASEPRAITFTISGMDLSCKKIISPLLEIAQKANLLYERMSRAKDDGFLEPYYTPNRMLWPSIGLDPQGQHARVSLKAKDIIAAIKGKDFPADDIPDTDVQGELF